MRVLIVDDHALFRSGLRLLLSSLDATAEAPPREGAPAALTQRPLETLRLPVRSA
jgi:DNA-binding NarL/FixJ family response regulator